MTRDFDPRGACICFFEYVEVCCCELAGQRALARGAKAVFSKRFESGDKRGVSTPGGVFWWAPFNGLGGLTHGQRRGGERASSPMRSMGFLQVGHIGAGMGGAVFKRGGVQSRR